MYFANLMRSACIIKDTFSGRGFSGVNMGHYADIADIE